MALAAEAPARGGRAQFVFARDFGARAAEINDFFNGFTGRSRSLAAYRWEWHTGPAGPALVWTITDAATGRLVGHHGIILTPMVEHGRSLMAGRTENTIIDPRVRKKLFYPAMEKAALNEALRVVRIMYTIHANGPGPLRRRFGYQPVGRWVVYLPRIGAPSLLALLRRARKRFPVHVPDAVLRLAAVLGARASRAVARSGRGRPPLEISEVADISSLAGEYEDLWAAARQEYDLTIDRSLEFLRWRTTENPNLEFRTWALRRAGQLCGVLIGHRHRLGAGTVLYVDDLIVARYDEASFDAALGCLGTLDPQSDTIALMTLAVDTPLARALRKRFRLQTWLLERFAATLFDELLALEKDEGAAAGTRPWYVTPIFTEGLDTSR